MDQLLNQAAQWMREANKIIALTGAGVSTESGIPDFRSANGLWAKYNPAEYATLGAFRANPVKVWGMLSEMEEVLRTEPNVGHRAMADMEAEGLLHGIITQNIDGLHQEAGSKEVVEFHGSSRTFSCLQCGTSYPREKVISMERPPLCTKQTPMGGGACDTILKPDFVFFDEMIPMSAIAGAAKMTEKADLILVAGTSCEVYPASEIPQQVRAQGGRIIEINLEPVPELRADISLVGKFSKMVTTLHSTIQNARS